VAALMALACSDHHTSVVDEAALRRAPDHHRRQHQAYEPDNSRNRPEHTQFVDATCSVRTEGEARGEATGDRRRGQNSSCTIPRLAEG